MVEIILVLDIEFFKHKNLELILSSTYDYFLLYSIFSTSILYK